MSARHEGRAGRRRWGFADLVTAVIVLGTLALLLGLLLWQWWRT